MIAAPEGEEPMPVTAVASVPHERYRSVQKSEFSRGIDLWFDVHAWIKGRSTVAKRATTSLPRAE